MRIFFVALFLAGYMPATASAEESPPVPTLINGKELVLADWDFVVRIATGGAGCTATVVGPSVLVTAAHCGSNGANSEWTYQGKKYVGVFSGSSLYPQQDHDIAIIITPEKMPKPKGGRYVIVTMAAPAINDSLFLAGYGCINPGGGGGNDGKLRGGESKVKGFSGFDIVSGGYAGSAALCFGDSGGPGFREEATNDPELIGVNSKGNIRDTNYNTQVYSAESRDFLLKKATSAGVEICGINGKLETCGEGPGPEPEPEPEPGPCDITQKKHIILEVAQCFGVPVVVPVMEQY